MSVSCSTLQPKLLLSISIRFRDTLFFGVFFFVFFLYLVFLVIFYSYSGIATVRIEPKERTHNFLDKIVNVIAWHVRTSGKAALVISKQIG